MNFANKAHHLRAAKPKVEPDFDQIMNPKSPAVKKYASSRKLPQFFEKS